MVPGPSVHNWELAFDASISGRERIEEWHDQDSWNRWPQYRQSLWRPLPTTGAIAEIDSKNGLRALAGKTRKMRRKDAPSEHPRLQLPVDGVIP